jgi:hypothetical protein
MSDDEQTRWEWLEDWLIDHEDETFTVHQLAASMGISTTTATWLIQGYLLAQRGKESHTLYVLKRQGRTRAAIWSSGLRRPDAQRLDTTLLDDIIVKVNRAWVHDARKLAEKNPKLAKRYERKVEAMMGGALVMLRTVLDDGLSDEGG